ncbi:hypothetical protein [Pedobacter miscanthi]|uniref:hypothetical protein n=1 Tax=Pedobacter miscanthi TaxID=2259170 RepID=UPI00292EB9FE|nr:hypothetical protein [Pedobacter miscanthi]
MYSATDALQIYRNNHFYAVILEYLAKKDGIHPDDLIRYSPKLIHKEISWNSYSTDVSDSLFYLICIGLVDVRENKLVYISKAGIESLQKGTYQQLANSSYFNYRSMKYSRTVLPLTITSLVIALTALVLNFIRD